MRMQPPPEISGCGPFSRRWRALLVLASSLGATRADALNAGGGGGGLRQRQRGGQDDDGHAGGHHDCQANDTTTSTIVIGTMTSTIPTGML
jgi:hypothetical protein